MTFWLALADLGLGEPEKARKHLGIALENSTNPKERAIYAAKLDWLNQRMVRRGIGQRGPDGTGIAAN